jgi:hypothetical protein
MKGSGMPQTTEYGFRPGGFVAYEIESFDIGQWCPDPNGVGPPTQVHLTIRIKGLDVPLVARFKSPMTIGILIEQLTQHSRAVWPNQI